MPAFDHQYRSLLDAHAKREERLKDETADECKARLKFSYDLGHDAGAEGYTSDMLSPMDLPLNKEERRMYQAGLLDGKKRFDRIVRAVKSELTAGQVVITPDNPTRAMPRGKKWHSV